MSKNLRKALIKTTVKESKFIYIKNSAEKYRKSAANYKTVIYELKTEVTANKMH